jgi:peptidoglycan hydrolase-like protein with peptidoglycan-binding domain
MSTTSCAQPLGDAEQMNLASLILARSCFASAGNWDQEAGTSNTGDFKTLEDQMANSGQPTIFLGATGDAVKRLERALRRTPNPGLTVDGVFGPQLESAVKEFQQGAGLTVDGVVGPATWAALPDGGPMPTLQEGSTGPAVSSLQTLLTNGAPGQWITTPQGIDGNFGPHTKAAVVAFQSWGGVAQDGIVGDQTWAVSLHAMSATLETAVGLQFVID